MFDPYRSNQKYCSDKCRDKAYKKKYKYKKKKVITKKCIWCGEEFETNNKKKTFCSNECYLKNHETVYSKKKQEKRTCQQCGYPFNSAHGSKRYCSNDCYLKAKRERETKSEN
jgi:predicted nucleic acid-binding Zn ribbon protein